MVTCNQASHCTRQYSNLICKWHIELNDLLLLSRNLVHLHLGQKSQQQTLVPTSTSTSTSMIIHVLVKAFPASRQGGKKMKKFFFSSRGGRKTRENCSREQLHGLEGNFCLCMCFTLLGILRLLASAETQRLHSKRRIIIVSKEFGGKQSHEIGPCLAENTA